MLILWLLFAQETGVAKQLPEMMTNSSKGIAGDGSYIDTVATLSREKGALKLVVEEQLYDAPDGSKGLCIKVKTGKKDQSAFVEIVDNGIGLEKEMLTKVFARGFTTKVEGLGFGLHYSANAIAEMNGDISIQSNGPSQGAIVRLCFPEQGINSSARLK